MILNDKIPKFPFSVDFIQSKKVSKCQKIRFLDPFLVPGRQKLFFSKIIFPAVLRSTEKVKYVL